MTAPLSQTLFDKYGGLPTLQRLVRDFHRSVVARPGLIRYFKGIDPQRVAEHQVEVIAYALGKPARIYNFDQLAVAHHGMAITLSAYEEMIGILRQVLLDAKFDGKDIVTIINTLDQHRHRIVPDVTARDGLKTVNVDSVTGLGNELALREALTVALERQKSSLVPLTLVIFGLDHPAQVFSQAGPAGLAEVEKHIALLILRALRDHDLVCRLGAGSYAMLLAAANAEIARKVIARIWRAFETHPLVVDTRLLRFTLGAGIAAARQDDDDETMIDRARRALASAQARGSGKLADG